MIKRMAVGLIVISINFSIPVFPDNVQPTSSSVTHAASLKSKSATKKSHQSKKTAMHQPSHKLHPVRHAPAPTQKRFIQTNKQGHIKPHAPTPSKKIATHASKLSHGKALSHHHNSPIDAIDPNPQDYVPVNNQNLNANLVIDNSANNQDFMNGGFNQQINLRVSNFRSAVCANAEAQVGKPYEWGVEDPDSGFDCSGLSQFVYAQEGIQIPRTAAEQYQSLKPVNHLKEGDLVFFRTHPKSNAISHVGIYIGDGYFVHSPRTGESIRISRLSDSYWREHYAGARRVLTKTVIEKAVAYEDDSINAGKS